MFTFPFLYVYFVHLSFFICLLCSFLLSDTYFCPYHYALTFLSTYIDLFSFPFYLMLTFPIVLLLFLSFLPFFLSCFYLFLSFLFDAHLFCCLTSFPFLSMRCWSFALFCLSLLFLKILMSLWLQIKKMFSSYFSFYYFLF